MVITIVGARPQFVKAAVVSRALARRGVAESIVHTGQHYDPRMSDVFWNELALPGVAANLEVGSGAQGAQTGQMMERLERLLEAAPQRASSVLLYGDTNSTLAGALVASKLGIPVVHVEAGLRSYDRSMPEEINRVVTDHLSRLLLCPGERARDQLAAEGITAGVHVVGDVMLDAIETFRPVALERAARPAWPKGRQRVLLTVHRAANTESASTLQRVLDAIGARDLAVIWPIHPRVRAMIPALRIPPGVVTVEPLSYMETIAALNDADVVMTDSGGLQKEAYWSRRPCLILRDETEWPEVCQRGWGRLVGTESERILAALDAPAPREWEPAYGDGHAADRIAELVQQGGLG